jgi:hypothetical protein
LKSKLLLFLFLAEIYPVLDDKGGLPRLVLSRFLSGGAKLKLLFILSENSEPLVLSLIGLSL